jgi:hypothetical protein
MDWVPVAHPRTNGAGRTCQRHDLAGPQAKDLQPVKQVLPPMGHEASRSPLEFENGPKLSDRLHALLHGLRI